MWLLCVALLINILLILIFVWFRIAAAEDSGGVSVRSQQMRDERARLFQYPWLKYVWRKLVNDWKDVTTIKHCLRETVRDSLADAKDDFRAWKDACVKGLSSGEWPIRIDDDEKFKRTRGDKNDGDDGRESGDVKDFCERVARTQETLRVYKIAKPPAISWRDFFLNQLPYMENSHAVEYVLYKHFGGGGGGGGGGGSVFHAKTEGEATAFLIPAQPYLDGLAHITYVDGARYALQDRIEPLMRSSAWHKHGGCDFFVPSMWDQGRGMFWHADHRGKGLMKNVTVITARAEYGESSPESTRFNVHKDISAVAIYESHVAELACRRAAAARHDEKAAAATQRQGLLFFAGSVHVSQRLRHKVLTYYDATPEDGVSVTSNSLNGDEYTKQMLHHKYCLQLEGYANLSPRVSEYTLLGCVPVVIIGAESAKLLHPLHRTIKWEDIVVEIDEEQLPSLTAILREEIRNGTYAMRYRRATSIRKMLTYHATPAIGDATWMTAYELVNRISTCKASVLKYSQ